MSAPDFVIPPDHYPPFAVVTTTDHSAWIIIATALGLSFILLFSAIKIFIRWRIPRIGLDEWFLAASTILGLIQSSIVLGACADGLGKSIELVSEGNLDKIQRMVYVSILFFVISLGLSKISVAFLLLRLTPHKHHRRAFYVIVGVMVVWVIVSLFVLALQCNLSHPWISLNQKCPGVFLRWQIISAFDIMFELALVAMTVYLVWDLHTSLENKTSVVIAFGMRLPLIISIAYRLATFDSKGLRTNPTFRQDKFIVWTQTELCYSIMAATIPSLRPFIKTLASNYGVNPTSAYGSGSGSAGAYPYGGSNSYQLSTLRPNGQEDYRYRIWSQKNGTRNDKSVNGERSTSKSRTDPADNISVESSDSKKMIIKKDTTWEVVADPQ
ncbi:hypothetical protein F5884DRAFT_675691 [Xylogone sp. PMI_703]|nr:hypothetical protein F5884DRAFT_675691 [Xylogone sp. PMI_703]